MRRDSWHRQRGRRFCRRRMITGFVGWLPYFSRGCGAGKQSLRAGGLGFLFFVTEMSSYVTMPAQDDPLRDGPGPGPAAHSTGELRGRASRLMGLMTAVAPGLCPPPRAASPLHAALRSGRGPLGPVPVGGGLPGGELGPDPNNRGRC